MPLSRPTLAKLLAVAVVALTAAPAWAQTLVYGRGSDSLTLDPAMATSSEDFKIADWVFDGLVRFDGPTTKIAPALAESWERSEDGLSWTFRLRKGVKFHDGTPFTAEAVKVSFERQFIKDHPSYSPRFVRWEGKLGPMTSVEVVDEHTLKLNFKQPQPALLYNLAIYPAFIASPTPIAGKPEGMMEKPVGTGPFKFVRWEKNNLIELVRNNDYWGEVPKVERLIVRVIPENDVRLLALQKGEIHLTDDVPFNRINDLKADPALDIQTVGAIGFSGLWLNVEKGPLKDIRVRKAIQKAINRDRVFKVTFFGLGELGQQAMPPGEVGHSGNLPKYDYDPKGAKALLAEAGFPNGFDLQFMAFANPRPYFPSPTDGIAVIQADLKAVGIRANVSMATWSDWITRRRAGDFGMTIGGWTASTVDPEGVITPVFHSDYIGADNASRFKDPKVDSLLDQARGTYDETERQRLYAEAMNVIADQAVAVFLAHPVYSLGVRAEVKGVYRNPANQVYLNNATLQKK
jgi:peptide/nickel transport system substrate-binding protein